MYLFLGRGKLVLLMVFGLTAGISSNPYLYYAHARSPDSTQKNAMKSIVRSIFLAHFDTI